MKKKRIWPYIGVVALIFGFMLLMCLEDLSKIPHRDEGFFAVETLTTEGEIMDVGESFVYANGRRRRRQHNISIFLEVTNDFTGVRVPEEELVNYHVGDTVEVVREVYYLKPGFRLGYEDFIGPNGVVSCVNDTNEG